MAGATGSKVMKLNTAMQYLTESSRFAGEPTLEAHCQAVHCFTDCHCKAHAHLLTRLWCVSSACVAQGIPQ